ncbi:hypothetical protein MUN81_09945 [Hymenobacter sp. 5317J-9]|uniref:hypothetical protein n=1 Tax=Hymenobacter sp. 5317J-9 TaxID=2932250 RepID=UPI001FD69892|nr:hypothetical protein [Hymenobacter sp. 5317J-9]UOQ99799.1 hypothetical protein MUN81_09945 [Hymenobacter sp. 5317J-9]
MYRIVTKYTLVGFRDETDPVNHTHHMALKPLPGVPHDFDTEQAALDWALNNHEDMRRYREFVVLPVHHMVLTWRPEEDAPVA